MNPHSAAESFLRCADLLPEPVLLISGDGTVLAANRGAREKLRLAAEAVGRPFSDLTFEDPPAVSRYLRECLRSRQLVPGSLSVRGGGGDALLFRAEGAVYEPRRDGSPGAVLLRLIPKQTAVGKFLLLNERIEQLGREVARRRRAQEELAEQKELLRVTLHSIGDAVIATDLEGRVTFMNPVACELTGWSEEDAAGRPLAEVFRIVNEESRLPVDSPVDKVLREGGVVGLANHTVLIARGGHETPIDDSAAPILDLEGKIRGVVLVFHGVGERRQMERELWLRAERLAEADRRKDEFLAMLSHELRNPLAPIRNALYILNEPGANAAMLARARDTMERQIRHLVRLVDDLLEVSRITRGKVRLRRERLDFAAAVRAALEAVRPQAEAAGIELGSNVPAEAVEIDGDPVRLDQVVTNLLNNAIKFTPEGGSVRLELRREDGEALLAVRDTGIGISRELIGVIFEPFVQAEPGLARSQGGLGIGLTLVRRLVEMHGGTVAAASGGHGRGSEFLVRLPLALAAAGHEGDPELAGAAAAGLRRVLVVDDNVDSAETVAMLVSMWGHEVEVAHGGVEGIEKAFAFAPDTVLLDVGLPGIDGYEVARRLRSGGLRDALLVAMTGYGRDEDRRKAHEAGFDHHLVKPLDLEILQRLLSRAEG